MNTHEQYVTLTTAKMLKRAGFDWEVKTFYIPDSSGDKLHEDSWYPDWYDKENIDPFMKETFPAPTQAVAMRWLREVKGWSVTIQHAYDYIHDKWIYQPVITNIQEEDISDSTDLFYGKETYEQAAEKGIQECLKIILNRQE